MRRGRLLLVLAAAGGSAWWWWRGDAGDGRGSRFARRSAATAPSLAAAAKAWGAVSLPQVDTTARPPQLAAGGGQVQLRVRLDGAVPAPVVHAGVPVDRSCPGEIVDSAVRTTRDGGVVAALVWVDGRRLAARRGGRRVVLAFEDCRPSPTLSVEPAGSTLELLQRDSVRDSLVVQHVARAVADTIVFDADGEVVPLHSRDWPAGAVTIRSLRFGWSRALVLLAPNGTARLTSDAGTATLDSLAPGRHVIRAWHPRLGDARTTVEVRAGAAVPATITFAAPR